MPGPRSARRHSGWLAVAGFAALVLALYGRSLGYGLMWDDPIWFRQGAGSSLPELFAGTRAYQFYRPLTLFYNQLWWLPSGRLDVRGLHAAQMAYHVLACSLTLGIARQWGAGRLAALLAALIVAVFPFSQQAVAWAATQQPLVTILLLASTAAYTGALDAAAVSARRRAAALYAVALALYGLVVFMHEAALPFLVMFWLVGVWRSDLGALAPRESRPEGRARPWLRAVILSALWAAPFALAAATNLVLRWRAPTLEGVAGGGFEAPVAAFLSQALAFPIARLLPSGAASWPLVAFVWLCAACWAIAVVALVRAGQRRIACFGTAWALLGVAPVWIGLSYAYVEFGQRLVYQAVPGIALVWGSVGALGLRARRVAVRALAAVAVAGILFLCVRDVIAQDRMMAAGTRHLADAQSVAASPGRRVVFLNFPDRFSLRRSPHPFGYWGVTLAPVVVEIGDFARAVRGTAARTESWSVPATGAADRERWPYAVDMRGVIADVPRLLEVARGATDLYLSDYLPDGGLRLRRVGALVGGPQERTPQVRFGPKAALERARFSQVSPDEGELQLLWRAKGGLEPGDTVFVHVFGPDGRQAGGADGDAWGGVLPLSAWPADASVEDVREVSLRGLAPGSYSVTAGIYRRDTNARLPAFDGLTGDRFPDDEAPIGEVTVPGG